MALTKPRIAQFNTTVSSLSDPITVLNGGATLANVDIGFLMNRANGLVSNVALYWNETGNTFVTAFTSNSGITNTNIAVTSYANITTGHVLPGANVIYSLGSSTQRWKDLWLSGTTIYLGSATISSPTAQSVIITNPSGGSFSITGTAPGQASGSFGNLIANSDIASTSTSTGALQVVGGAGITGNVFVGNLISSGFFNANGSRFSEYGNATVAAYLPSNSTIITITNNIIGANSAIATANLYNKNYTDTAISNLINLAPATLDTLGEIAANLAAEGDAVATIVTSIASVNSNVTAANARIASIDANLGTATTNITTLFSNAATQQTSINNINANLGTATTNINSINANIGAYYAYANANLGTATTNINSINANTGAYYAYANANLGTATTNISNLQANTGAYYAYANANLGTATTNINSINANIGAYHLYANANLGTATTNINSINANLGTATTNINSINANLGTATTNISALQANTGAYYAYANANIGTATTNISNLQANVGAYHTYANANLGTATTNIGALQANTGAYHTYANANLGTATTNIGALQANTGAYYAYANANLGTATTNITTLFSNAEVQQASIDSLRTGANANTAGYLSTSTGVYVANLNSGNARVTGGYADNFPIGANTKSSGGFTTLSVTDVTQITNATNSTGAGTGALQVTGGASFGANVYIGGNLEIAGTQTTFNTNNITVDDSILYIADNNSGDVVDIGFVGHFINPGYQHTGFVRDASDGVWKLFANVVAEPTTTVDFTNAIYPSMLTGSHTSTGTVVASAVNAGTIGNTSAVHIGATGRFDTSVTTATLNAATIGNTSAVHIGATGRFDTSVTTATLNAATIGNTGATLTGTISIASQPNITSVGTLTSLAVGAVTSSGTVIASTVNAGTIGNTGTTLTGTLQTSAQPNITSVGTLLALTVSGVSVHNGNMIAASGTTSTSITTGAAVVVGGLGVSGNVYSDKLYVNNGIFWASNNNVISSGGGGSAPAGVTGQVQYNNGGTLGATPLYYWVGNSNITTSGAIYSSAVYDTGVRVVSTSTGAGNLTISDTEIDMTAHGPGAVTAGSSTAIPVVTADAYGRISTLTTVAVVAPAGTLSGTTLASGVTASSLTSVGTIATGTWSGLFGAVSGAALTGLTAGNLSGTIPSAVLANSTHYIGTTAITLNRASGAIALTGITSIDGAAPAGSLSGATLAAGVTASSLTSVGTIVTGTWSGLFGAVSGANLTSLTAGNLSGTIPSGVLGNSTHYIGTTAITLNRASGAIALTGITSIDGAAPAGSLSGATLAAGVTASSLTSVGNLTSLSVVGTSTRGGKAMITNFTGATAPANPQQGDEWYNSSTDIWYKYFYDGANYSWVDQSIPTSYATLTVNNILNGGSSGTGSIGSAASTFATVYATTFSGVSTTAKYADLAEKYVSDADYPPGTVVEFGGEFEITKSTDSHSTCTAGVISTNPAHLMNSALLENHAMAVALTGRVPCYVIGTIRKGDRLVSSDTPGVATVLDKNLYEPGCIIGKALENYNSDSVGIIEIAVGRY